MDFHLVNRWHRNAVFCFCLYSDHYIIIFVCRFIFWKATLLVSILKVTNRTSYFTSDIVNILVYTITNNTNALRQSRNTSCTSFSHHCLQYCWFLFYVSIYRHTLDCINGFKQLTAQKKKSMFYNYTTFVNNKSLKITVTYSKAISKRRYG